MYQLCNSQLSFCKVPYMFKHLPIVVSKMWDFCLFCWLYESFVFLLRAEFAFPKFIDMLQASLYQLKEKERERKGGGVGKVLLALSIPSLSIRSHDEISILRLELQLPHIVPVLTKLPHFREYLTSIKKYNIYSNDCVLLNYFWCIPNSFRFYCQDEHR